MPMFSFRVINILFTNARVLFSNVYVYLETDYV